MRSEEASREAKAIQSVPESHSTSARGQDSLQEGSEKGYPLDGAGEEAREEDTAPIDDVPISNPLVFSHCSKIKSVLGT